MLPSQANMAMMTGASRASIREAMKTMEAQGLIRTVNGKGIFIENVDTSFHSGPIKSSYIIKLLVDAIGVRKALEGMAVEYCTILATDEQLQNLSEILAKVEILYHKGEPQSEYDLLFHQTLIALADNNLLTHMLKNLMQHSSGIWKMQDNVAEILSGSIPGHRVMMDYMLARDIQGAVAAHNKYMNETIDGLKKLSLSRENG